MLGEVYIASALAIFFAIFGWSNVLFGLSKSIKEKEAEFIRQSGLGYSKYVKLRDLLNNSPKISSEFTQKLMKIVRNTKLNKDSSEIIKIIEKNEELLKETIPILIMKKIFFLVTTLFLFVAGTFLVYFENILQGQTHFTIIGIYLTEYICYILVFQLILILLLIFGSVVYYISNKKNSKIQEGLEELILRVSY